MDTAKRLLYTVAQNQISSLITSVGLPTVTAFLEGALRPRAKESNYESVVNEIKSFISYGVDSVKENWMPIAISALLLYVLLRRTQTASQVINPSGSQTQTNDFRPTTTIVNDFTFIFDDTTRPSDPSIVREIVRRPRRNSQNQQQSLNHSTSSSPQTQELLVDGTQRSDTIPSSLNTSQSTNSGTWFFDNPVRATIEAPSWVWNKGAEAYRYWLS